MEAFEASLHEYEQSDWESTRRSFQSVRSYEEIRGAFDSKGGQRPQRSISTTVNVKSSMKTSLRSCERSTTCIRALAKHSFVTFSVAEPANWLLII